MPNLDYSVEVDDRECAKAMGKELRISPKDAMEICRMIKGMRLRGARKFLEDVVRKKESVPYFRHNKKLAHRKGSEKSAGRYPVKAAQAILKVLENVKSNAEYKGMDVERLKIIHMSAQKGIKIPGFKPRAYGRATPFDTSTTNVEVVVKEA